MSESSQKIETLHAETLDAYACTYVHDV